MNNFNNPYPSLDFFRSSKKTSKIRRIIFFAAHSIELAAFTKRLFAKSPSLKSGAI